MKKYRFYKLTSPTEDISYWFIDLKWFPFNKAHLQMVAGADLLLDKLAKGKDELYIEIGSKYDKLDYSDLLIRSNKLGFWNGAVYKPLINKLPNSGFGKNKLWLCAVTNWVFLRYPKKIYFKVV